uniref:family 43 glycosylhydrolase n=1 Tax=Eubacterium cellulosolvens TaxID=29322 RepID=UPI000487E000|nr:family 43 glycosylhydrolase [[Eubacterium] cellulosolvens]
MIKRRKLAAMAMTLLLTAVTGLTGIAAGTETVSAASKSNGCYVKGDNENNPVATQRYSADPGVMVYNDTVYMYSTNDIYEYKNGRIGENTYGTIKQINCFSSKDLVNWTDHGAINVAGNSGAAKWAACSWAPCAAHKKINGKEKFFLYFANSGGGIGVLTSDSPTGPWKDPLGRALIDWRTPGCSGIVWMFDPAVMVDDDGTGYLVFGGGVPTGNPSMPGTSRVVKLGADMISLANTPTKINAPYLFEDSGINKIGGKYVYSYCSNWNCRDGFNNASIEYMTASNPMGPYTYQGEVMKNPGVFFEASTGNNHHSIFEFKGKYYLAYHSRSVEHMVLGQSLGYRTAQVDQLSVSGSHIDNLRPSMTGPSQLSYLNPYETVQAETLFNQVGIQIAGEGNTYVTDIQNGDWTKVKGANFNKGLSEMTVRVRSNGSGSITVRDGSPSGTVLGTISFGSTGGSFKDFKGTMKSISGVKNICFVFSGSFDFDSWTAGSGGISVDPTTAPEPTEAPEVLDKVPGETAKLADGWYYIKNVNAQKYLTVAGNTGKNAANLEISKGTGVDGQKWYLENNKDGYITLKTKLGNFNADIAYGKDEDGANVQIYENYGGEAQQLLLKKTSTENTYIIATRCSQVTRVYDAEASGKTDGTNVLQWRYNGRANQQWVFEAIDQPTPKPTATATPKPTSTPKPTATSTPKPTATSMPKPTATPKPTSTPKRIRYSELSLDGEAHLFGHK